MKFTEEHEWLESDGDMVKVGITEYAAEQLGDIVFIELPDLETSVTKGQEIVVIESVKAASDILAPLDGEITEINNAILDDPLLVKNCSTKPCYQAMMGDIVFLPAGAAYLKMRVDAAAPVRSVDIFNGTDHLECYHPYEESDLGDRITVLWEGAEYRGRFRAVSWDFALLPLFPPFS